MISIDDTSTSEHHAPVRDLNEVMPPSNCYARDARNSCVDPDSFTSTYHDAKRLLQNSGVSLPSTNTSIHLTFVLTILGITIEDVKSLSTKFWEFYIDGSCVTNTSACALASIHTNLCMGTITPYTSQQPQLYGLLKQLERFEVCGQFMLTEIGHGLDARSIETTATLSPDGKSFDLHTPSQNAAKSMPPVTPLGDISKIAVVYAQLVVGGEVRGFRTFVVHLTDGKRMCPGISTKLLPQRPGTRPLDHAVTTFTHVRLDRSCLLGTIDKPKDSRQSFFQQIQRVSVGGLALSLVNVPALKAGAYLAHTFSQQRVVTSPTSQLPVPISSFPTQYGPIISTASHATVMEAAGISAIDAYKNPALPPALRQAMVCIFKAMATYTTQRHLNELSERCGWRGLFGFNKISELQLALKGNSIAEGDVLVLCIRLASELLQGKYQLPPSSQPDSLLAQHERGLFKELQQFVTHDDKGITNHRSNTFAQHVTPRARDLIKAIGHRYAYDSALASNTVQQEVIDVWESECLLQDAGWYVDNTDLTYHEIHQRHTSAVERLRPHLQSVIDGFGMEKHFGSTPIVSTEHFDGFLRELPEFGGDVVRSKL